MIIQPKSWREACETVAIDFANETMQLFQRRIVSCAGYLPNKKSAQDRGELLDIFLDCFTGMLVKISTEYTKDMSRKMQDLIVAKVNRQFTEIRKRSLGGPGEEVEVPIVPDGEVH